MQDQIGVNPYAAPSARIEQNDDVAAQGYVLAERGTRFFATLIDSLLWAVTYAFVLIGVAMMRDSGGTGAALLFIGVASMIALLVLQCVQMAKTGQTYGKKWLGIRVLRSDGSKLQFGRFLGLRWGVSFLIGLIVPFYGLIDACFIFAEDRRTLHDKIADTVVVIA